MSDGHGVKIDPTGRELKQFAGLCVVFFAALGAMAGWRGGGLLSGAQLLGAAWLISLIFNGENRGRQLLGVIIPGVMAGAAAPVALGANAMTGAVIVWVAGGLLVGVMFVAPGVGRKIYVGWMLSATPIGWTVSTLVLMIVYYGVLTPIGLMMRMAGRDALKRRFDGEATSYWMERRRGSDSKSYFRQF